MSTRQSSHRRLEDAHDHGDAFARHLQTLHVERGREDASTAAVDEMTGRNIAGIASAFDECRSFSRRQRLHDNLRVVPSLEGVCQLQG